MKVYELMKALADIPSGAEVVFFRLADLSEMPRFDGNLRQLNFVIRTAEHDDGKVFLDGWAE